MTGAAANGSANDGSAFERLAAEHLGGAAHDLGPQLEPALKHACNGRLSDVRWFRTDWQIGGAATAYATFRTESGPRPVVVKLPVGFREYRTLTGLCDTAAPTPRVAQHGMELGGYDMAWIIMERVPGDPLAAHRHKDVFELLAAAAAEFYKHAAERWPLDAGKEPPDWSALLTKARRELKDNHVADASRWIEGVKHVQKLLPRLTSAWSARPINCWCHGDLHPGNLMRRDDTSPWGPPGTVLLDFAETHCGHWVEDAVYLERLYWGRPQSLDGLKPVSLIAKARRTAGLDASDDYATLANIRRVLMAATVPAFMHQEGHPRYLQAALEVMERTLPMVGK